MMRSAASLLIMLVLLTGCLGPAPVPTEDATPGSSTALAPGDTSAPPSDPVGAPTLPSLEPPSTAAPPSPDLAHRPLVWFAPHAETRLPDFMKGSADYFDLFAPNADWSTAAQHVQIFQTCDNICLAREPTDSELRAVIDGLSQRGMAFAMELGALPHPLAGGRNTECGIGIEGFGGEFSIQTLERIRSLGGRVDFVGFGEPFAHATLFEGPNACLWSIERVAAELVEFVRQAREVFPDVIVGDTEPAWNGPFVGAAEIGAWLDAYAAAAGEPLGFFHLDVDWTRDGWPTVAREIEDAVRSRGVPFGIIYNGGEGASSDAEWLQLSAERAYEFEERNSGDPDHVIFQSWHFYPTRVLPESDPATFTGLLNRYFAPRTGLATGELDLAAEPPLLMTTLSTVGGAALAGAELRGRAIPLDGQQQVLRLAGEVAEGADEALVAIRINSEGAGPGTADISLYEVDLTVEGGQNQVQNPRFAQRLQGWFPYGEGRATTPPSDRGPGRMLHLRAGSGEVLDVNTSNMRVTPGVPYQLGVTAAIPLGSERSGYISVIFLGGGEELRRDILPLAPAWIDLEPATTDGSGEVALRLAGLEAGRYGVEVLYAGDLRQWPSRLEQEVRIGGN